MPNGGTFDHLIDEAEQTQDEQVTEDSLKRIRRLAGEFKEKTAEYKNLEAQLKEHKAALNVLSQELIPESMMAVGMNSFQLDTGETVAYKEEISVTVKDYDSLYKFLEERGDDALMKITLEIGKVPKNVLAMIVKKINETFGILATAKLFVHPMTLKKYVKELCGIGGITEAEIPLAELDENMVKTFTFYKTTVK